MHSSPMKQKTSAAPAVELPTSQDLSNSSQAATLFLGALSEADKRERKVASLRSAIAAGSYRLSAAFLADAILRSMRL